jgi:ComF family protein
MLSPHPCQDCLTRPPSYRKATAVFEFEGSASTLLHAAKFRGNTRALKWLARQAQANFLELCEEFQPQYLLPVPLSWRRKWKRGFNQSYLLAHYLRKAYGKDLPIWQEIRRSHTEAQSQKNRKDRLRALKGVFSLRRISSLQGAKILVMDDVMTTGATVETLSRAVLAAGAGEVRVFVLARVGKK